MGILQKREKKRWIFRKPTSQESVTQQTPPKTTTASQSSTGADHTAATAAEQRHAIAMAVAKAAAAEAAVATAQAAVEVARLTRPSNQAREYYAAIVIQTAFRGYLVSKNEI